MFKTIDRDTLAHGLSDESILLVDVRELHEFAAGHIPGSFSMPLSIFDVHALPAAEGRQVVFSCAAGVRSVQALMLANEQGAEFDTHYAGGFRDWAMSGMPVER